MYLLGKFAQLANTGQDIVIKRNGVVGELVIPAEHQKLVAFEADIVGDQIILKPGESIQILTDKIGHVRNSDGGYYNVVFVEGGMLIDLTDGQLLLEAENGEKFILDSDGDVTYPRSNAYTQMQDHTWVKQMADIVISNRYGITSTEASPYTDNLLIDITSDLVSSGDSPCFNFKVGDSFDISNGRFAFVDMKEVQAFFSEDNDDELVPYTDSDDDNFETIYESEEAANERREREAAMIGSDEDLDF